MRLVSVAESHQAQPGVQQRSVRKALLIAQIRQPGDRVALCGALLGDQRGNAVVGRMIVVEQQAARQMLVDIAFAWNFIRLLWRSR